MKASDIISATPLQLLQITYELLIKHLGLLSQSLDGDVLEDDGIPSTKTPHDRVIHCQNLMQALTGGLNLDYEVARDILPLYIYINKLLIECQVSINRPSQKVRVQGLVSDINRIVDTLYQGVKELPDIDVPEQNVYASYGRSGELQEYTPDLQASTDYKA